jgi:uncharacterized LabA/DUF88 family protein
MMVEQWEKERRVLLDTIQNHPSQDLDQERERLVVLNKLLEERGQLPPRLRTH